MAQPVVDPEISSSPLLRKPGYCFSLPCFRSRRSPSGGSAWWQRIRPAELRARDGRPWWTRALLKLREWSEIVAGPRWKTFIRRFSRHRGVAALGDTKLNYDPSSYSLNFDDGPLQDCRDFDEDRGFRSFSTRYASVRGSGKAVNKSTATAATTSQPTR